MVWHHKKNCGLSLVEVIVVAAIVVVFFGGFFGGVHYTLGLISDSKARLTALTVANDYIEYIRSLTYDAVGTTLGIPAGVLPQVSTTTLNGVEFTRRVLIEYIDDPADGLGSADHNGITTDYKQAKITVEWTVDNSSRSIFLVTNIIPRTIETDVGGGTLRVNVLDATISPLPGASVRLVNNTLNPAIDVTRVSDSEGVALFGGAPAGSDYEIFVFRNGYSADQTYQVSTANPNPTTRPVTVLEADITSMTFFIDQVSDVSVKTLAAVASASSTASFFDDSDIVASSDVVSTTNGLTLSSTTGLYSSVGTVTLATTTPTSLMKWQALVREADIPLATAIRTYIYDGTVAPATLISNTVLPGNEEGFIDNYISLANLSVVDYPSLVVLHQLATTDTAETPTLITSTLWYRVTETSSSGEVVTLTGAKSIGQDADEMPIYKNILSGTTDGIGQINFSAIEWDGYTAEVLNRVITEVCPQNPIAIMPATINLLELVVSSLSGNTLRVVALDKDSNPLIGAKVTLSRPGYEQVYSTSPCGQVFFSGLVAETDYTLSVTYPNLLPVNITDYGISGSSVEVVQW